MRTNFVLIDSENVKPEYIEKLRHEHFRVIVFVGAHLKRLDFPIVNALQSLGFNGSYIQISSRGPNALDFHIAYYIGKLAAAHPDAGFHIISKDKGFDPLIRHLNDQKILCSRLASVLEIPFVKSAEKPIPHQRSDKLAPRQRSDKLTPRPGPDKSAPRQRTDKLTPRQRAEIFYDKRITPTKSRPATVMSLESTILSHFNKMLSGEEIAQVLKALTATGRVVVNGKKVTYPDRR